jgi:monofunctional glycosyltransferase
MVGITFLCLFITAAGTLAWWFVSPDVSALKTRNPGKTAFMEYREEQWRSEGKRLTIRQRWVPLKRISPYLVKAVLIAEDDKFWMHKGFDVEAMQKAMERDLKEKKFHFGGSTVSQQLVKNLYLSPSKSPVRKVREALITWRMERSLGKKRILEIYLNVVEWGNGVFGAEAAALHYFGKNALALAPEEAATLAAVLPSPLKYSASNPGPYVQKRSRVIYGIMVRRGIVAPEYEDVAEPDVPPAEGSRQMSPAGPGHTPAESGSREGEARDARPDTFGARDYR